MQPFFNHIIPSRPRPYALQALHPTRASETMNKALDRGYREYLIQHAALTNSNNYSAYEADTTAAYHGLHNALLALQSEEAFK